MRFLKNMRLASRISLCILIVTVVGMLILWSLIAQNVSSIVEENISNQMYDAVNSRAAIIEDYVSGAEKTMVEFSLSSEVKNLLKDPNNTELTAKAQSFTEKYGAVQGIFEGLYIATPESLVLTHINKNVVGITTRTGDGLESLKRDILSKEQVTNAGIMMSKGSSNAMVMSLYYPIYDNNECIGFVGSAVYADRLMESITGLEIKGLPNKEYIFLNAADASYIYNEDSSLINEVSEDKGCLGIIDIIKGGNTAPIGSYSYTDNDGTSYLAAYSYLADRGWIFIVKDKYSEVYGTVDSVKFIVTIVCALFTVVLVSITLLIMRGVGYELTQVKKSLEGMGRLELDAAEITEKYADRKDEIGTISNAVCTLSSTIKNAVNDIGRILGEMSEGNLTVDVSKNKEYYIGDLKALAESLEKLNVLNSGLVSLMRNISVAAEQVHSGSGQVATGSNYLSTASIEQTASIEELAGSIHQIEGQAASNSASCRDAQELISQTYDHVRDANERMSMLTEAMNNIGNSSAKISNIIKTIEDIAFQTNILALNAAVEAARAGEVGKGFAVVADEVRNLAAKSADAVSDTTKLIEQSSEAVNEGTAVVNKTAEAMSQLNDCIIKVKGIVETISDSSDKQTQMVSKIDNDISQITGAVQSNSATAEESAAVSEQLSAQAGTLKDLVRKFNF
ncbi:MAG: methyl-accepting chemotaxis protein [Oscillospiraceae bacterium]|nr:methyl-accepting chemotaxis protein [Oscillospiraceae bacterium]